MSSASEARVTSRNVTLDNCDREQIQFSNAVQPHAVLLVVDAESHRVLQASANADELRAGSAPSLAGRPLSEILAPAEYLQFRETASKITQTASPRHLFCANIGGLTRDVFAHLIDRAFVVEFERQGPIGNTVNLGLYTELRNGIAHLNAASSTTEFLNEAVQVIGRITGFERVMAYRFHADGSGEVVAESVAEGLTRYLGLHYPAADIPKPARRLFSLTWVRHLPDVDYAAIPILPETNQLTNEAVDLSYAFSRSVSVMYTEYLRNMGVRATMVLTLFKNGKLWGLISCMHHSAPRHLNIEVRGICEMMAQTISLLMSAKEDAEFAAYRASLSDGLERMMHQLARQPDLTKALTEGASNLLSAMDASGAAVLFDGDIAVLGQTPGRESIEALASHIAGEVQSVWASEMLTRDFDLGPHDGGLASGVLATRIGHSEMDLILWFRPEYRQTVNWAGDPSKLVVKGLGNEARLHPNGSFDVWKSEVRGRAKPWLECEIEFAARIGREILEVVVERTREVAKINQDLKRSNRELEEFVYTASHDLKSPLRGIASYAQLVLRGSGNKLEDGDRDRIRHIVRLAQKMDGVIEGLLRYSELGHTPISRDDVDLNDICDHAIDLLRVEIEQAKAEIRLPNRLPVISCDVRWVAQILVNLIGNALKYNDKAKPVVEIGYQAGTGAGARGRVKPGVLYVRDNGIGIAPEHTNAIFRLFHRLHSGDRFGSGTGLGLAIVARAVERHDGRLWLESQLGKGTTFYFTLAAESR